MGFVSDTFGALTGKAGAEASLAGSAAQGAAIERGIGVTEAGIERGLGFLEPFGTLGQQGIDQAGFLTDPQAQFQFLQDNPLFQLALDEANRGTQGMAAARGRLSAGDTLQQLSNNVLLSASPLIAGQKQSITDLLNMGTGVAGAQASTSIGGAQNISDLITTGGAVEAGGVVGAANARAAGTQNLLTSGLLAGAVFSDERLKSNIKKIGAEKGHNIYSWTWNKLAESLGLIGDGFGVIAQEVMKTRPDAIILDGYLKVNYAMLDINHAS